MKLIKAIFSVIVESIMIVVNEFKEYCAISTKIMKKDLKDLYDDFIEEIKEKMGTNNGGDEKWPI